MLRQPLQQTRAHASPLEGVGYCERDFRSRRVRWLSVEPGNPHDSRAAAREQDAAIRRVGDQSSNAEFVEVRHPEKLLVAAFRRKAIEERTDRLHLVFPRRPEHDG